ncbi:hypothetical protein R1sor_004300 [Riccia sorocarpa]|uniref:Uncharacterized protein n=1 Tax=Riccia sorocarpa TaxID=122646 RepID=A0ABD3HMN4_9MARC
MHGDLFHHSGSGLWPPHPFQVAGAVKLELLDRIKPYLSFIHSCTQYVHDEGKQVHYLINHLETPRDLHSTKGLYESLRLLSVFLTCLFCTLIELPAVRNCASFNRRTSSSALSKCVAQTAEAMAYYANRGMDPSLQLPLGVLMAVMFVVLTPLTMDVLPRMMEAANQMLAMLWIVPVVIITMLFMTSADNYNSYSRRAYRPQPQYTYSSTYGSESGPSWGLLGLMLLLLLLLPWRY